MTNEKKTPMQTPEASKAATDHRAQQLDGQHPTHYRDRGHTPEESQKQAKETTQSNQEKGKGK